MGFTSSQECRHSGAAPPRRRSAAWRRSAAFNTSAPLTELWVRRPLLLLVDFRGFSQSRSSNSSNDFEPDFEEYTVLWPWNKDISLTIWTPMFWRITFVFLEQVDEESPVSDSQLLLLTSKRNWLKTGWNLVVRSEDSAGTQSEIYKSNSHRRYGEVSPWRLSWAQA